MKAVKDKKTINVKIINEQDVNKFLRNFWWFKIIFRNRLLNFETFEENKDLLDIKETFNIKNKKERLSYIYDIASSYIDETINNNFCEFKNDKCLAQKKHKNGLIRNNGCCGSCKYLVNKQCSINSLGCKLYYCQKIKCQKKVIRIKDIVVLDKFLSLKQKLFLRVALFETKEETMKDLQRKSIFLWSLKGIKKN